MLREGRNESGDELMILESPSPIAARRKQRLGSLIQRELSSLLLKEVSDPRISRVTITGVEVSADGSVAKVRLCRMMEGEFQDPTPEQIQDLMKGIRSASKFFFAKLKKRIPVRYLPHLVYEYDDSIQKSSKVWKTLSELSKEENKYEPSL